MKELEYKIIFFDGLCNLCDGAVDFIVRHGDSRIMKIAPLQSEVARKYFSDKDLPDSIVFYDGHELFFKSSAVIKIALLLGGPWKVLAHVFSIVPSFILDFCYDLIAKYRYKIFGKKSTCRVPTDHDRMFFI